MRKITLKTATAFLNQKPINMDNTRVEVRVIEMPVLNGSKIEKNAVQSDMYLHNNWIAQFNKISKGLWFSLAGWNTPTTRERLNGLFETYGLTCRVRQIKGKAYISTPTELVEIEPSKKYVIGGGKHTSQSIVKDFQNMKSVYTACGWVMPEDVAGFTF
tara:strand:- start:127 stop:603 length:477 start_codon:yes stop_codon:yes gene_type:complete